MVPFNLIKFLVSSSSFEDLTMAGGTLLKTFGFLTFSGDIEKEHWAKMG